MKRSRQRSFVTAKIIHGPAENNINSKRKHDSISFDKKGHKDQYEHNFNVLEKIECSIEAIEENNFNASKESFCEGKKLLNELLKLIQKILSKPHYMPLAILLVLYIKATTDEMQVDCKRVDVEEGWLL